MHLEERHSMQWLLPNTDEIAANSTVNDPLLGNYGKFTIYLHNTEASHLISLVYYLAYDLETRFSGQRSFVDTRYRRLDF
jgi:hypothetical protein